ncbi:hypothetical protein Sango_0846500 [Sesamum angolense]|uniref:Uncharacterized protein n=1 Tax=Sesamum angolense TaxID=2727404 RepID=A0AAE2C0P8_9LAMI|nr:hypothetical protein Sango_0846500 [Sesamum angolense]
MPRPVPYPTKPPNLNSAKRQDTWCPRNHLRKKPKELSSVVNETPAEVKLTRADCTIGPLLPFEVTAAELCKQEQDCNSEDCTLPDPNALLHVITSRRKVPSRTRSLPMVHVRGQ